jgi:glucosamine--fructose-6-phosphate aminotransferase (isomerizing)
MSSGMRADIADIPAVVERVLGSDDGAYDSAAQAMERRRPRWVSIAARGTSDHVAVYAQYLLEAYLGLPTGLALPSVTTVYEAPIDWRGGLLIAISQSGESPDVRSVVEAAREGGALTIAITNEPTSPLAASAEYVLDCRAGSERAVPATKTYVGCLAAVARLVASVRPASDLAGALPRVPDMLAETIELADGWLSAGRGSGLVAEMARAERALIVSRGYNLATALEVALKLKEGCGLFAAGYSSADVMHGPMVLAMPDVPMLAVRPDGPMGAAVDEALAAARSRGAHPWIVGGGELAADETTLVISGDLPESLTPLAYVLPGQLLTDQLAATLGRSPDAPIGLTKVTRTT